VKEVVGRLRKAIPGVKIIGATVVSAVGTPAARMGAKEEVKRKS
jgi:hypothetical protein